MVYSRRDVLKLGLSGAAICTARHAAPCAWATEAKKIPIGMQIHPVRKECEKDFLGVLAAVAKMGYQGVELAHSYYGYEKKPHELRKLLDDNGLKCCGMHTKLPMIQSDQLQATIEFSKILGNKFLIVPGLQAKYSGSKEALTETIKLFNDVTAQVKEHGMQVGYHTHGPDFKKIGDTTQWEFIFDNTKPEFIMQVDVANTLSGGGDPYAILRKYPGRATTIHLRDYDGTKSAVIGEGTVKWDELFQLCETIGKTEWYIVECGAENPLEAAAACLKNLHKMGR